MAKKITSNFLLFLLTLIVILFEKQLTDVRLSEDQLIPPPPFLANIFPLWGNCWTGRKVWLTPTQRRDCFRSQRDYKQTGPGSLCLYSFLQITDLQQQLRTSFLAPFVTFHFNRNFTELFRELKETKLKKEIRKDMLSHVGLLLVQLIFSRRSFKLAHN